MLENIATLIAVCRAATVVRKRFNSALRETDLEAYLEGRGIKASQIYEIHNRRIFDGRFAACR